MNCLSGAASRLGRGREVIGRSVNPPSRRVNRDTAPPRNRARAATPTVGPRLKIAGAPEDGVAATDRRLVVEHIEGKVEARAEPVFRPHLAVSGYRCTREDQPASTFIPVSWTGKARRRVEADRDLVVPLLQALLVS